MNAIDGDPRTAWTTGGFSDVIGDRLVIDYTRPITTDHIDVLQTRGNRWITKVTVLLDGVPTRTLGLDDSSFTAPGQRIDFEGPRTFSSLEVRIDDANVTGRTTWLGLSNVGFREVTVPGVTAQEWIVTPTAGLDELSPDAANVAYDFSRLRSNPIEGFRQDTELQLRRIFRVATPRSFVLSGRARLTSGVDGAVIDGLIGRPGLAAGFPIVGGTDYLDGVLDARPSSALDGDLATAWTTRFDDQVGATATVTSPTPMVFDRLRLALVNDVEHSVPTALNLTLEDGSVRTVNVPEVPTVPTIGNVVSVEVPTGPITSRVVAITVAAERPVTTKEYFSGGPRVLPIAIAEFGLPVTVAPLPARLPDTCRTGLVSLDGNDESFVLQGTVSDALDRRALPLVPCGPSAAPQSLSSGDHRLVTAKGLDVGIDVDALRLQSAPESPVPPASGGPTTVVSTSGTNSYSVDVTGATEPFWLVLGQSLSDGWRASIRGGDSLGPPTLIDGFANGWLIDPATAGSAFTVEITWAPQGVVWIGLIISAAWFFGLCLAAVLLSLRSRRRTAAHEEESRPLLITAELPNDLDRGRRLTIVALVVGVSALIGGLGVAVAMGVIALVQLQLRRRTLLSVLALLGAVGGIVVLYTGLQFGRDYPTGVEWPSGFLFAHQLGLVAVLIVVSETVTRFLIRRRSKAMQKANDPSQINDGSALTR